MKPMLRWLTMILMGAGASAARAQVPDLIFADFEGKDYGAWKVEGTAFGSGPAHGALPKQMKVEGFLGKGLVNSFNGGDNVFAARLDGAEAGGGPVAQLPSIGPGHFNYDIQVVPTSDGGMLGVAHDGPGWAWLMTPGADPSQSSSWSVPAQFTDATTRRASRPGRAARTC